MLEIDVWEIEGILIQSLISAASWHVLHFPQLSWAPGCSIGDISRLTPSHHIGLRYILTSFKVLDTLLKRRHNPPLYVDHPEWFWVWEANITYPTIIKAKVDRVFLKSWLETWIFNIVILVCQGYLIKLEQPSYSWSSTTDKVDISQLRLLRNGRWPFNLLCNRMP